MTSLGVVFLFMLVNWYKSSTFFIQRLQTFFLFLSRFFTFFNVFYFSGTFFTSMIESGTIDLVWFPISVLIVTLSPSPQ